MSLSEYIAKINAIPFCTARKKLLHKKAIVDELEAYRGLAGELICVGGATLPQATDVAS